MTRFDLSKILFYTVSILGALGGSFAFGLYSGAQRTVVYDAVLDVKLKVEEAIKTTIGEIPIMLKVRPDIQLQRAYYDGEGVTVNDALDQQALILLSGFFEDTNELRLIRRDGVVVARWPVRFSEMFPDTSHRPTEPPWTDWHVHTHGALVLPDGSVVFNFSDWGLVKLDRCGGTVWKLARAAHHSVEQAEGGGFWVPGKRFRLEGQDSQFPPFKPPFREDTVMKVSEDGEVLLEFSVPALFYDNGLEALLTASRYPSLEAFATSVKYPHSPFRGWYREIVHLNKVEELTSTLADDFPMFEAGDLALSLRGRNLVMVVDPDTRRIKWWKVGPWLRQHDPEFKAGGTLAIFNNNVYSPRFDGSHLSRPPVPRVSNIMEINPASGEHRVLYGGQKDQVMLSIVKGKHELTPNGGLLVTETEGGRVFETDPTGRIIWEYINRYDSEHVAEITEARVYPESYFTVSDWSCDRAGE